MVIDNRVPVDEADQSDDDLATAAHAAAGLASAGEADSDANRAIRTLAHRLAEDPERLRRCILGCRRRAEHSGDPAARQLWQRAERLTWNALTLVETLRSPRRGDGLAPT